MADYFSLIERAVTTLAPDNVAGRAEKYRQAEKALANYLAGMNPPMNPDGVRTEMASLAAACQKVESRFTGVPNPVQASQAPPAPAPPAEPQPLDVAPSAPRPTAQPQMAQNQRPTLQAARNNGASLQGEVAAPSRVGYYVFLVVGLLAIALAAVAALFLLPSKPAIKAIASASAPAQKLQAKTPDSVPGTNVTPPVAPPAAPTKNTAQADAVGTSPVGDATPASAPAQADPAQNDAAVSQPSQDQAMVASHALLVVQVPPAAGATDSQPKQKGYQGTATWRLVDVNTAGQRLQKAVVAEGDIPDADVEVKITIQKNIDKVFPASHTIRVDFKQLPGAKFGVVKAMLMPAMREDAKPAGTPLIGLITPVLDNHFIVALQDDPSIEATNLDLLKNRPWIDLRVKFASGVVAVFSIEKGLQGDQALGDALKSWGQ